jgi:hypothetical protein
MPSEKSSGFSRPFFSFFKDFPTFFLVPNPQDSEHHDSQRAADADAPRVLFSFLTILSRLQRYRRHHGTVIEMKSVIGRIEKTTNTGAENVVFRRKGLAD